MKDECGIDLAAAAGYYTLFMQSLGLDTESPNVQETPQRVARALAEMTLGVHQEQPPFDFKVFDEERFDGYLIERDISFSSLCEHHHLAFTGMVDIAVHYDKKVLGLSKFSRLVEWIAARPQTQERMNMQIVDELQRHLGEALKGVYVSIQAKHLCVCARGAKNPTALTITAIASGQIDKAEVLSLLAQYAQRGVTL